ncbi:hypothetical protein EV2_028900 [Malus domestica]
MRLHDIPTQVHPLTLTCMKKNLILDQIKDPFVSAPSFLPSSVLQIPISPIVSAMGSLFAFFFGRESQVKAAMHVRIQFISSAQQRAESKQQGEGKQHKRIRGMIYNSRNKGSSVFEAVSVLRGGDGFNCGFIVLDGDSDGVLRTIKARGLAPKPQADVVLSYKSVLLLAIKELNALISF